MRGAFAALFALAVPYRCISNVLNNNHAAYDAGASHVKQQTKQQVRQHAKKGKDIPGGPREKMYTFPFDQQMVPFSYVNVKGSDNQWHTTDIAAPEMRIDKSHFQIPNPNDFSMVPDVIAPEDKWPDSSQSHAHDVDSEVKKYTIQQATTMGGAKRFGPAWFMRNYRMVQAPEDKIPQQYFTYFERQKAAKEKGKGKGKSAALAALRGKKTEQEGIAEVVADEADVGAAEIAQDLGKAIPTPASVSSKTVNDNSLALAEAAVADGDAAVSEAEKQAADIKREEVRLTTTTTTMSLVHFTA